MDVFRGWRLEVSIAITAVSAPYCKNDNAGRAKELDHVRQLVGYGRLEGARAAELLNDLYAKKGAYFRNF